MGRTRPLLIALLVIASMGTVPGTVVADDQWPDECHNANIVSATNTYSGTIDTPGDVDILKLRLEKGEYVTISGLFPEQATNPRVQVFDSPEFTAKNATIEDTFEDYFAPGREDSYELWAEETGVFCLRVLDASQNVDAPYNWQLSLAKNSPEPAGFEVTELRDRVSELESQLQQKNQRISELESLLEQKNQTISELESQSSDGSGGDVTIQVTVTPANGQQNFVEGGEAVVQAESENADVSEMSVEYGSGTYQLDSSGQVAIPLAQTGTQEMTLVYGDTTKQVSIEVQAQEGQNQQNQQNQQDTTPTGTSGPGFGVVVALIAILGSAFLLQRYRQS